MLKENVWIYLVEESIIKLMPFCFFFFNMPTKKILNDTRGLHYISPQPLLKQDHYKRSCK